MKPLLILLSTVAVSLGQNPIPIEPPSPGKLPRTSESAANPATPRVFEFSNDDISVVLRAIARQAKINVVVHEDVKGRVTMRLGEQNAAAGD
jgi:type II secretory pathway component HofQ